MGGVFPFFLSVSEVTLYLIAKKGLRIMVFFVKSSWNINDRSRVNEQTKIESDIFFSLLGSNVKNLFLTN